jgi:hypothetical protein
MSTDINMIKEKRESAPVGGYFIIMAADIILLYLFNNVLNFLTHPIDINASQDYPGIIYSVVKFLVNLKFTFLTKDFTSCLWAINLALFFGIIGNFVLLLYRPRWFHHLMQAIPSFLAVLAIYIVLRIFPFSLQSGLQQNAIKIVLFALAAGFGANAVYEFVRFIIDLLRRKKTPPTPLTPPQPLNPSQAQECTVAPAPPAPDGSSGNTPAP